MGFKDEVISALERAVADAGNKNEAARKMGLKSPVTLHNWLVGTRAVISEALDGAMNSLGYHVRRDGEEAAQAKEGQSLPMKEDSRDQRIAELEEELMREKIKCDAYEALVVKLASGSKGGKGGAESMSSPA